ncbi:MAG: VWA domain-containing protein [Caldilineaceae bacterium]
MSSSPAPSTLASPPLAMAAWWCNSLTLPVTCWPPSIGSKLRAASAGQGIFTALNGLADEPLTIDESLLQNDEPIPPEAVQFGNISSAVILLLTDGENTGPPDPLALAQVAAQAGVRIFTIGIGSTQGAVIELDGFRVNTQLNEPLLQEMARLTNGTYYYAEDADALREIYKNIDLQLTIKGDTMEVTALAAGAGF